MFENLKNNGFEIEFRSHSEAILGVDFPEVAQQLESVLLSSTIPIEEIIGSGGGETKGTQRLRNALAAHGWKVTGIDIADEGLRQARDAATRANVALDLVNTDVTTYDFGRDRWDLVTLIYAPSALKRIPDIQRSLRPGGLFVYEYFAPETPDDDDAAAPGQLKKQFADGWEVLRDDVVDDVPDWAQDKAKLERFVARKR